MLHCHIPLGYGSLWGASDTGTSGLVIVNDRYGTRGYDDTNRVMSSLKDEELLGVDVAGGVLKTAVTTSDGERKIVRFNSASDKDIKTLDATALSKHRVSPDVTVAAVDGKHALIPHTKTAKPETPRNILS